MHYFSSSLGIRMWVFFVFYCGIILDFFDFLNCLFEPRDIMFDCLPDCFGVHAEVCVDEFVVNC